VLFTDKPNLEEKSQFCKLYGITAGSTVASLECVTSCYQEFCRIQHSLSICPNIVPIYKNILYYTVPVTALQMRRSYFSRPCATTLYRTSQYISVLLHIYYILYKITIPLPCRTRPIVATPRHYHYYSPYFYQDSLCPTRTNFVSRVYSTVLFAIPRHYYTYALSIYIIF
jgi:hypothetical protein